MAFQEAMRSRKGGRAYTNYETKVGPVIPEAIRPLLPPDLGTFIPLVHDFSDAEKTWTVSLSQDFLAIATAEYVRWEEFENELRFVLSLLHAEYSPDAYTRIGLRYKDVINPTKLGCQHSQWSELLKPFILGELGSGDIPESSFEMVFHKLLIKLDEQSGHVLLQHGLAKEEQQSCYVIDSDFYTDERTEVGKEYELLRQFNAISGRLFRWCITAKLHQAMGPVSPDEYGHQSAKSA